MIRSAMFVLVCLLSCSVVRADWDPELERQEEAARAAERQAEAKRQAEADAMRVAAMRQALGAESKGLSDGEVRKRYNERFDPKRIQAEAVAEQARAQRRFDEAVAPNRTQVDAATRAVTGKTMAEMQNMSEAELEAMARELEEKYGE